MNDWIEWNGGKRPVDGEVFYRMRNGDESADSVPANMLDWSEGDGGYTIVAYRLAEPETTSEPIATINIDDALDELSEMMQLWINNRQNGRTPRHIKMAILSMIKEISEQ